MATASGSLWVDTSPQAPEHPPLAGEVHADVAVIGGGITGITTARLLQEGGATVALVEADRLGSGVTGHTTAKVTSLHGAIYTQLRSSFGADGALVYGQANEAALSWIGERIAAEGIDCDLRRRDAYTYAASGEELGKVEDEAEAAAKAGLPAELVSATPLPYPVAGAVRVTGQAEFHPLKFALGLAAPLSGDGANVFEHSRVQSVSEGSTCRVQTAKGAVVCEQVVVATLLPILDRSLGFARTHPERSYCVAALAGGELPEGMFINAGSPTRSIRIHSSAGEEYLVIGGEGHKVGQGEPHGERYDRLEEFARRHFDVEAVQYRWSAQDYVSVDHAPYVGRINPLSRRLYMATGYAKWGFTNGVVASLVLAREILGESFQVPPEIEEWPATFGANRFKPLASAKDLVKERADDGFRFFADRVRERGTRPAAELGRGEGGIVSHRGRKVAGYRDEKGRLHAVSARCTHLGCQLHWNDAERSWDCPCHGSRFGADGSVLQGPAVRPLKSIGTGPAHSEPAKS